MNEHLSTFFSALNQRELEDIHSVIEFSRSIRAHYIGDRILLTMNEVMEFADILAELSMDYTTITVGFLHDFYRLPDTMREVKERFGAEEYQLVQEYGIISKLAKQLKTTETEEDYIRLVFSAANDFRVILMLIANRYIRILNCQKLPPDEQSKQAQWMLSFYVPLAHRLGMARFKMKMEDTAFKILHPEIYTDVSTKLSNWRYQWDRFISRVSERFKAELEKYGIDAEVIGRTKNILSIYRKMQRTGKPFEQIYDTLAIRAIVKTISDCYKAMAVALQFYKPIVKEFDDYIQKPKINGYRSLHLLLEDENKIKFELQIRTEEMHRTAEIGIAAHWNYKEGSKRTETDKFFQWFRENASDSTERFNSQAVGAFFTFTDFKSDIFVITPKGDLKSLPRGATPIDFAFAIHKDIGFHCSGAKVNGQIVPFNYELQNGDRVELMTANHPTVNTDWMKFVQTPKAIAEIRRWIRHQMLSHSIKLGEEILIRTFRKNKISITENTLKTVGDLFNYDDVDKLYAAVGAGKISAHQIIRKLNETEEATVKGRNEERRAEPVVSHNELDQQPLKGIKVGSINNLMVNFGKCCQPIYGDPIVGYITRGKGISIHRTDCINVRLLRLEPERQIEVEWEEQLDKWYTAGIKVGLTSASHFIEEVTPLLEKRNIKLLNYQMYRVSGGDFYTLVLEVPNIDELQAVIFLLSGMKSVGNVRRLQYGEFKSLIPGRSAV